MANTKLILSFLEELGDNNNREWMEQNKAYYLEARDAFEQLVGEVLEKMKPIDEALEGLEAKNCIFRLHRDIRFSKDKTPYKIHFGAYLAEGGKKSENAGYYIHLQPNGESMLGGGIYQPPKESLVKIRQEIDYNSGELKKITDQPNFKELFGAIEGEKLQRPPKGYDADHPNIELLKLKSFFLIHKPGDHQVTKENFSETIRDIFKEIKPFNDFMNVAIS